MTQRVLYVIATLDPAGAERQLVALATHLDRARFEPTVCCIARGGPLERDLGEAGIETIVLGKKFKFDLSVVPRLAGLIREREPAIVHTWLFTGNAFGRAAAVWAGHKAIVASERSVDRWRGVARVMADRWLAKRTARIIANANAVKQFYVERERIPARKIVVVPNGVDLARFERAEPARLREELGLDADTRLVGCVARLEEQKGVEHLVRAAKQIIEQHPQAAFVVAGGGPLGGELRSLARQVGVAGRFHLLGHRDDVPGILAALDVFVLPSLWEGLPNAALEAMAAGRPVVATAVDGTRELVSDRDTGLLAAPRSPEAIADAVGELLADAGLAKRLAEAGRAHAQCYTIEAMVERTQAVYDEVTRLSP